MREFIPTYIGFLGGPLIIGLALLVVGHLLRPRWVVFTLLYAASIVTGVLASYVVDDLLSAMIAGIYAPLAYTALALLVGVVRSMRGNALVGQGGPAASLPLRLALTLSGIIAGGLVGALGGIALAFVLPFVFVASEQASTAGQTPSLTTLFNVLLYVGIYGLGALGAVLGGVYGWRGRLDAPPPTTDEPPDSPG
jgi:hypothetical protein